MIMTNNDGKTDDMVRAATLIEGDIFSGGDRMLVHQLNCASFGPAGGIARAIFDLYPYSNVYTRRGVLRRFDNPAHVYIDYDHRPTNPQNPGPIVVGLLAQVFPGLPQKISKKGGLDDTEERRVEYFKECLRILSMNIKRGLVLGFGKGDTVAVPWKIGCGLAGGDWGVYHGLVQDFAATIPDNPVRIYRLPGAE